MQEIVVKQYEKISEQNQKLSRQDGQAAAALGLLLAYQQSHDDKRSYMQCSCELCQKTETLKRAVGL